MSAVDVSLSSALAEVSEVCERGVIVEDAESAANATAEKDDKASASCTEDESSCAFSAS